jgi:hypothetical protein
MISDASCSELNPRADHWNIDCNSTNFIDNSGNCINRQLCVNKEKTKDLLDTQSGHLENEKRYTDERLKYDKAVMNAINLGIGIVFVIFIIFRNRNVK